MVTWAGWQDATTGERWVVIAGVGGSIQPVATMESFWADPFGMLRTAPSAPLRPASAGAFVPAVPPTARVLCIGVNYADHVQEGSFRDEVLPEAATIFGRWPSTLCVDGSEVPLPSGEPGLDWEGEVAAVVGAPLADATADQARAAIVAYAAFNDLSARIAQKRTSQWTMGKNADRSGPIGNLVSADEVGDLRDGLRLRTLVNGEVTQDGSTAQMIHEVGEVLAMASETMTLLPGDVIATGTPAGVGYARTPPWFLGAGDRVEVEVERLGSVAVTIVARGAAR